MNIKARQAALFARLDELGISTKTVAHEPAFTVEESKHLRGEIPGGHCKSLFLKARKGQLYLLVAMEDTPINLKNLSPHIGEKGLSFAKEELLVDILGVTPGSVTPFALINDTSKQVKVLLDDRMLTQGLLNYHPLLNDASTSISPKDLQIFVKSCGHAPTILSFDDINL